MPTYTQPPAPILSYLQYAGLADANGNLVDGIAWNPETLSLVNSATGGPYDFSRPPDPSQGSMIVTDLNAFNSSRGQEGVIRLAPGETPFFGVGDSAQGYNAGLMPNSGIFASANPDEIAAYRDHASDVTRQGVAQVAALVGGGAALGGMLGPATAPAAGAEALTGITLPAGLAPIAPTAAGSGALAGVLGMTPAATGSALAGIGTGAAVAGSGIASMLGGAAAAGGSSMSGGLLSNLGAIGGTLQDWGPLIGGLLGAVDANNQPDSMTTNQGGTSTSTSGLNLPPELLALAQQGLVDLSGLYGQGYQQAPMSSLITGAQNALTNRGTNSFATGANQNTAPTSSMFATGQEINPYLDQVFNAAADSTQNRLASEFANAGRLNTGSHQQSRSQELQNLSAGIYGTGYESERQRQYGAAESGVDRGLTQADSNLARMYGATESNLNRDLSAIAPMLATGDYMQQYDQQGLDAQWTNLQQYLSGLQGLSQYFPGTQTQNTAQTGNVTQPLFNNPLAGFLGGAQLGSLFTGG